jgi:TonB family protein
MRIALFALGLVALLPISLPAQTQDAKPVPPPANTTQASEGKQAPVVPKPVSTKIVLFSKHDDQMPTDVDVSAQTQDVKPVPPPANTTQAPDAKQIPVAPKPVSFKTIPATTQASQPTTDRDVAMTECATQAGAVKYKPGAGMVPPKFLAVRFAEYPLKERNKLIQGDVDLCLIIGEDGVPTDVKIIKPLGYGLDENVLEVAKEWGFDSGIFNGKPTKMAVYAKIRFTPYFEEFRYNPYLRF